MTEEAVRGALRGQVVFVLRVVGSCAVFLLSFVFPSAEMCFILQKLFMLQCVFTHV